MKAVTHLLIALPMIISMQAMAQTYNQKGASPKEFPELVFTNIKGAPKLSNPVWINGTEHTVSGKGMGWASPLLYDADADGLDDLLIGEFGSGLGTHAGTGNFLQFHKNIGTREKPQYSGKPTPLFPAFGMGTGTPLSIFTWCCMGFTPRLADMDGDGELDLVTGQYDPGDITWFKKYPKGFGRGELIEQVGINAKRKYVYNVSELKLDSSNPGFWLYSTAAFLDMYGNGLNDMIVGGNVLRVAKNIGTKSKPKFGYRELLKDVNGNYLTVWDRKTLPEKRKPGIDSLGIMGTSMVPYTVDWDNDGVMDLLVTDAYIDGGRFVVTFFKGVKKNKSIVFQPGIPLFVAKNGGKAFPGSHPNITVADWNHDGIKDLIIGTVVSTMKGKYDAPLSWSWELDAGTYKCNPAYMTEESKDELFHSMKVADSILKARGIPYEQARANRLANPLDTYKKQVGGFGFEKLAHEGFIYVMLGSE